MKRILAIVLAVAVLSEAKVAPPATTTNSQTTLSSQFSEYLSQTRTNFNNLAKQNLEQLSPLELEAALRNLSQQGTDLVTTVEAYLQNMTEEVKNKHPEYESLWNDYKVKWDDFKVKWNDVKVNISKAVEDLNSGIPNAQEQVADLQAKFQQGVVLKESDTAPKSLGQHSEKI